MLPRGQVNGQVISIEVKDMVKVTKVKPLDTGVSSKLVSKEFNREDKEVGGYGVNLPASAVNREPLRSLGVKDLPT